jgi:glutathione S-transferase
MILRSSPFSPFGRKVKIAAALLGLKDRITVEVADTMSAEDSLRSQNPLGKIPVLVPPGGAPIYDSRVILEHLDMVAGGGRLIPAGAARIPALTLQALADGVMDALILQRYELTFRPEGMRSAEWLDHQKGKVERGLAHLEANPRAADDRTVGGIAVACLLGYLDIRFEGAWRAGHPRLVAWLDRFAAEVPSFGETDPRRSF